MQSGYVIGSPNKLIVTTVLTHKKICSNVLQLETTSNRQHKMSIAILESMSEQMLVLNDKQGKKEEQARPIKEDQ